MYVCALNGNENIPMGITYASFAGLTIISTVVVGVLDLINAKFFIHDWFRLII